MATTLEASLHRHPMTIKRTKEMKVMATVALSPVSLRSHSSMLYALLLLMFDSVIK